ncbi:MAG TPA: NAD(P)-dependent oxidoreductase [Candidatus Cloacimonetes bacterium]|nr:NAD(P)-dependent oxidoreductase [Candidatus Cloacimonadota bacterium]
MINSILITGISGFIGKNVARRLIQKNRKITALIRPSTDLDRIEEFEKKINFAAIDLADIPKLRDFLKQNSFDCIVHIGAIRGGRKFPKQTYFEVNVNATEQLLINALKNNCRFIFCSSVGVFGAIPNELPANNQTERRNDNYYHYTKIQAEALLQKYVLQGLNAVIIRPAITYGIGDFGFPFTLTKLIDKSLMFIPDKNVMIHLTSVELLSQAFAKLIESNIIPGTAYNIADKKPVKLRELVNFISNELKGKEFPPKKIINKKFFQYGETISRILKNETWISRFELISKSWFYDTNNSYNELSLKQIETIPNFKVVTNWYKSLTK